MKRLTINYWQIVLLLSIALSFGCTKNLEENPKGIVGPLNSYANDADFNAAINGTLNSIRLEFCQNGAFLLSGGGEDVSSNETNPEYLQYDQFKPTLNGPWVQEAWGIFYKVVNQTNAIISKVGKVNGISDANKAEYEGQARYLRAFAYFYLTRWFGEVPIMTTENQLDAVNVEQSPVLDIYTQIITDLTFAEDNLPLTFIDKGRPTKAAAKAMLAKVYLTMAGWPLKDVSKYALARDKAKEVMDLNMFSLEPHQSDLWLVANKFTNKEFIFFINCSSAVGGGDPWSENSTESVLHEGTRPSEEGGWDDLCSEARFIEAFPEGPRKNTTFWTVFADENHTTWQNSLCGKPFMAKYRDGGAGGSLTQGAVNSYGGDGFFPIHRYADILLIYAEASNMAEGSPSSAATDAINLVRRRAGENDQSVYPDLPYGMTQAAFDVEVLLEREWELAFECDRWFDLVRKEQVVSANIAYFPWVQEFHRLLPKPQIEIELLPKLKQNEGYN